MKETETIFSSTGRLGVSRRQDNRLYINSPYPCSDPHEVERNFERLIRISERYPDKISRCVFRGLVNEEILEYISNNGLHPHLEVALSAREFTQNDYWIIYLANNSPNRRPIVPPNIMIEATNNPNKKVLSPLERVKTIVNQGYTFIDHISEDQIDQVYTLWGETFGWQLQEVDNLRRRLITNQKINASQRDVWFSAIKNKETIISIAMAERLTIPSANGSLHLIESTEWKTRDEYSGKGLMTATLCALNAQILSNFQYNSNELPFIYAECNFQSRSDRAGYGAGFRIPERTNIYSAPQILIQNVSINDGQPVKTKLRDFTFMYLPVEIIKTQYNPMQVEQIVEIIKT